jgi:site-specific DNA recombinase
MTSLGADRKGARVQCSAHRESGVCKNKRTYYRDGIECGVLSGLKKRLADQKYLTEYIREYNAEMQNLARGKTQRRAALERRAGEIARNCHHDRGHQKGIRSGPHDRTDEGTGGRTDQA